MWHRVVVVNDWLLRFIRRLVSLGKFARLITRMACVWLLRDFVSNLYFRLIGYRGIKQRLFV
jgi:hypothetical protein